MGKVGDITRATVAAAGLVLALVGGGEALQAKSTIAQQSQRIDRLQSQVSAAQARISGEHRNLLTCGDIQSMIDGGELSTYWQDENYSLQSTTGTLPNHCINR